MKSRCLFITMVLLISQAIAVYPKSKLSDTTIYRAQIGKSLPVYSTTNIMNYTKPTFSFNDYKGKVLVLDFWSFGCAACVQSWSKLLKIQEEFKDDVRIILINPDNSKDQISTLVSRQEKIHGYKMNLPIIYGDKSLRKMFPYQFVPHVVYVDKSGKISLITGEVNKTMIESVIRQKTQELSIKEKKDTVISVSWSSPLLLDSNISKKISLEEVAFSSVIMPSLLGVRTTVHFVAANENIRNGRALGVIANLPLKSVFSFLYGREYNKFHWIYPVPNSRILFRNVDTTLFVSRVDEIRKNENYITVQVTTQRDIPIPVIKRKMIRDIEDTFAIKTYWEEQSKMCIALVRSNQKLIEYATGTDPSITGNTTFIANNITTQELVDRIAYYIPYFQKSGYPIIDKTEFKGTLGNINIKSTTPLTFESMNKELEPYGLMLVMQYTSVNLLVIDKSQ